MAKLASIVVEGYECILCQKIYVVVMNMEKDEGCPECGGPSNYLETVEVNIG